MSNLWRISRRLLFTEGEDPVFPCELIIQLEMSPPDFFGVATTIRTSMSMAPVDLHMSIETGLITATGSIPDLFDYELALDKGVIRFHGNWGVLQYFLEKIEDLDQCIEWLTVRMTTMLSVQTGIYFEIRSLAGKIGNLTFSAVHDAENLTATLCCVDKAYQNSSVRAALTGISHHVQSYRRFEVASRYYLHALRLVSPVCVNFPPYTVSAEVLLNLVKCLETIFATDKRRLLRGALLDLGLTTSEIETQIIPITLIRNEFDVGHSTHGLFAAGDIPTLRLFVSRSVSNIGELLKRIQNRISFDPSYLYNIHTEPSNEHKRLVADLSRYLQEPPLSDLVPAPTSQS